MKLPVEGKGIYIISHPDHPIILEKKKNPTEREAKDEAPHPALMHFDNFQARS
jgi:hypothetical protein